MEVATLAVHPAYWIHGHGADLVEWCIALGDRDDVPLAVNAAAPMRWRFFRNIGFQEAATVVVEGCEVHPEPIGMWLGLQPVGAGEQDMSVKEAWDVGSN